MDTNSLLFSSGKKASMVSKNFSVVKILFHVNSNTKGQNMFIHYEAARQTVNSTNT